MTKVFFIFSSAYFLSYGMRTINATISTPVSLSLNLSPTELGLISSVYFVSFTLLQMPMGLALDRWGARRVETFLLLFAALGCVLFGLSESFVVSIIGRALMGFGFAAALMGPLHSYRLWFNVAYLKSLATGMLAVGTIGVLASTLPVQWHLSMYDWRSLFYVAALAIVLIAALLWFGLKDMDNAYPPHPAQQKGTWRWRDIFMHHEFRSRIGLAIFLQGGFIALQSLWVGPWLEAAGVVAAPYLFIFNGILLLSYLLWTSIGHRLATATLQKISHMLIFLGVISLVLLALLPLHIFFWLPLWILFFISASVGIMIQAEVTPLFPHAISGRVSTAFNSTIFGGAFVVQAAGGVIIDYARTFNNNNLFGMQLTLLLLALCQAVALWLYFRGKRQKPQ